MPWTAAEVAQHNSPESCWVIISGHVYDLTDFLHNHPGGVDIILRFAGKDATQEYEPIHSADTITKELPPDKHLGPISLSDQDPAQIELLTQKAKEVDASTLHNVAPDLKLMICLDDFENAARRILTGRAWYYYSSASETGSSHARNLSSWSKVTLRPRVLRNVEKVNMRRKILGYTSSLPFFIAPCALGRLGHPEGECCLARGAAYHEIPYVPSMASSVGHEAILQCTHEITRGSSHLFFQMYVKKRQSEARETIRQAKGLGFSALMVTIDTPVVGKRAEDEKFLVEQAIRQGHSMPAPFQGPVKADVGTVPRGPYSSSLSWDDLEWIADEWANAGPLCLKGISSAADARLAVDLGYKHLYLSNHGGRQLDGAPSALETLLEIRKFDPTLLQQCEILLDGGVRKGSDILKALALGATAVGIGRPFMYALSVGGTDGVMRAIDILKDELQTNMRLLGVTSLDELNPTLVNSRNLELEIPDTVNAIGETRDQHLIRAKI